MNMLTKFQVDIFNSRTPAAPRNRRRILLSSTVGAVVLMGSVIMITILSWAENCQNARGAFRLGTVQFIAYRRILAVLAMDLP